MRLPDRRLLVVTVLLVGLVAVGMAGTAAGVSTTPVSGVGTAAAPELASIQASGNNTTVRHVDPDTRTENSDLTGTSTQLQAQIAQTLQESNVQLSQGQYEQADGLAGAETRELLGRYVDVAGDTGGGTQDNETRTIATLRNTTAEQRQFVNATRRYNRTYRNYTQARRGGTGQRAARLASRLHSLATNATTAGRTLQETYASLSAQTGTNLTAANASVAAVMADIRQRQRRVRTAPFTPTELTIQSADRAFAFRSPGQLQGRLTTRNGTPISNESLSIRIGTQRDRVRTDATGTFRLQYRPVRDPLGQQRLSIDYWPRLSSPYLGSQTNISATVTGTEPTVAVAVNRTELQYGDRFAVTGRVAVDDVSVPHAPVVVRIGSHRVGNASTNGTGQFRVNGTLPATVASGTQSAVATVSLSDRAIRSTSGNQSIPIRQQATRLDLTISDGSTPTAVGRLTTAAGSPIPGQLINITADGRRLATGRTDEQGRYDISINQSAINGSSADIVARFAGTGTNLAPESARRNLSGSGQSSGTIPVGFVLAGVLGSVSIAGGGLWIRRYEPEPDRSDADESTEDATDASTEQEPDQPGNEDEPQRHGQTLLTAARSQFHDDEPTAAIELAYAGVRHALGDERGQTGATNWEFYRDVAAQLSAEHRTLLEELTSDYEAAIYAETADMETADTIISVAWDLLEAAETD